MDHNLLMIYRSLISRKKKGTGYLLAHLILQVKVRENLSPACSSRWDRWSTATGRKISEWQALPKNEEKSCMYRQVDTNDHNIHMVHQSIQVAMWVENKAIRIVCKASVHTVRHLNTSMHSFSWLHVPNFQSRQGCRVCSPFLPPDWATA